MRLPKAEHSTLEWQAAVEALILVAENRGPTMLAPDRRHAGRGTGTSNGSLIPSAKVNIRASATEGRPMTVFVHVDTSKQVGDPEHIEVFATGCCFPIPTSGERNG
jgi:hypothetical protein